MTRPAPQWDGEVVSAPPAPAGPPCCSLVVGREAALACLRAGAFVGSPFQSADFADAYWTARARRGDIPLVFTLGTPAGSVALLPLTVRRRGPFRIAEVVGGTHTNTLGWRTVPTLPLPVLHPEQLAETAAASGLRVDALVLRRVEDPAMLGPGFEIRPAPETRFSLGLAGGLPAVLALGNAKRKKKRFRAQQRHFEAVGGYHVRLLAAEERAGALAIFLEAKAAQFAGWGDPDPFAEPGVAAFLHRLYVEANEADVRLYVLEARGAIKAIFGGILEGDTFWGMFSGYVEDEDAEAAPGDLLRWHLVERLAEEGVARLDLGPGQERYKSSWCDSEIPQYDAFAALTPRGRIAMTLLAGRTAAEQAIKQRPGLRARTQRLRRLGQRLRLAATSR